MEFAKIKITGTIELLSGMHIGASDAFAAIGATDSPVIKDSISGLPMIPGTSLKGKMRSLLAKAYNQELKLEHKPDDDHFVIRRVFGDTKEYMTGRLIFNDSILSNQEELLEANANAVTEVKFENAINRVTSVANPRQIERVIRGSKFNIELIYEMNEPDDLRDDMTLIKDGFALLELDYLGGHGTRGYGRVKINDVNLECVFGYVDDEELTIAKELLER